MELREKLERCRAIDFVVPLGEDAVRELVESSRELRLVAEEVLFQEGDPGDAMYVVLEGQLLVYKDDNAIATLGPGTYVGEMALVESKVRSASVRAVDACTLLEITEAQFHSSVTSNPRALLAIMKTLSLRSRNDLQALDSNFRRLREYSKEIEDANRELEEARRQLMRTNRELEKLSTLDTLTGLANRRRFDVALRHEWRRAAREGSPLSLIIGDIDCFKAYNDTYGHPAGDEVLARVGDVLRSAVRRPGDLAARYGGEEFVVILVNADLHGAEGIAERLRASVEALRVGHEGSAVSRWITVSFGVASVLPHPDGEPEELLGRADRALYAAKQAGRNRVAVDGPQTVGQEA